MTELRNSHQCPGLLDVADEQGAENCAPDRHRCDAYQDERQEKGEAKQKSVFLDVCEGDKNDQDRGRYIAERDRRQEQRGSQQENHNADRPPGHVKSKWPTWMNRPLEISQDRNGAPAKTDQILSRQPPLSDESREDGFSNPRDHLDRHRRKHDAGHRGSDGRGRQNAKKQDDDAERTLVQGGQQPAKGEVIGRRLPEKGR